MRGIVDHLHANDQKYIVMVNPAIAYQDYPPFHRGVEDNIFLLRSNGSIWKGVVWPGVVAFPDWFSANVSKFWDTNFDTMFNKNQGVDIDGLWIDMNEPSNFPCNFPCDDPDKAAIGFPPTPPPVRTPPRPLPGWPCEFQPVGTDCKRSLSEVTLLELPSPDNTRSDLAIRGAISPASGPLSVRQEKGNQLGLPGRDLLYPKYAIHNKAAFMDSWNAEQGGISNKTVNTDVIHQNGLAQYDTHNLFGTSMFPPLPFFLFFFFFFVPSPFPSLLPLAW
jgi:alpha-glucosidase